MKALARVRRGNPPGKESSIGDALNWGGLLTEIEDGTDIYFVSEDKDYRSQLSPTTFNEFLKTEWEDRKTSEIFFYTRISHFFKANFPNIKIASEVERDLAIEELGDSGSQEPEDLNPFASRQRVFLKVISIYMTFTPISCILRRYSAEEAPLHKP